MHVLVVNVGSSGLKLRVLDARNNVVAGVDIERWTAGEETAEIAGALRDLPDFGAVGHRVVHGGGEFRGAVRVDDEVERSIAALSSLAPLHQPRAVAGIRVLRRLYPDLAQIACFDTTFHATLADAASTYALPWSWRERWDLRRFGFHGLSHAYASRRAAELIGRTGDPDVRVITCHIGAGASLCATRGGLSVDTTMGFTPLEGLVMATRSGTVDPGLITWLVQHGCLAVDEVARSLEADSGLAGLSRIPGGDMRDVLAARLAGEADAVLAFDVYAHRLRRELGSMMAVLGGLDALVFTGGVGEHSPEVRRAACADLDFAGVQLDDGRNASSDGECEIGAGPAKVRTFVVTAREEVEIAGQVRALLDAAAERAPG